MKYDNEHRTTNIHWSSRALSVSKSQWSRIEAVQTIGLSTISLGYSSFVRNDISCRSTSLKTTQETIANQASEKFHKNSISRYPHIRSLGCNPSNIRSPISNKCPLQWISINKQHNSHRQNVKLLV